MKFQATILAAALAVASFDNVSSFTPSIAVQSRQKSIVGDSALSMAVAVDEDIANGETKTRKTRKVSSPDYLILFLIETFLFQGSQHYLSLYRFFSFFL